MRESTAAEPAALIPRAREGSDAALGALLELYRGYLHLLARLRIPSSLRAKLDPSDAVQETFLHARRGFAEFRGQGEAELIVWLRRILAHTLADEVRRFVGTEKRNAFLERQLEADMDQSTANLGMGIASPISSPSHQASRREEAVLVADALERLPAHYRDVILLGELMPGRIDPANFLGGWVNWQFAYSP